MSDLDRAKRIINKQRSEILWLRTLLGEKHRCECGDEQACQFARERDAAREQVERLRAKIEQLTDAPCVDDMVRQYSEGLEDVFEKQKEVGSE